MNDNVHNAGDRKSVRRAEKAARQAQVRSEEIIRMIAQTPAGREWLWAQLSAGNIFSTTFHESHAVMGLLEGKRSAALALLDQILSACPEQFILMMQEHNAKQLEAKQATEAEQEDEDEHAE